MQLSKKEQALLMPITFYNAIGWPILLDNLLRVTYKEIILSAEFIDIIDNLKKKNLIITNNTHVALRGRKLSNKKNYTETILQKNIDALKSIAKFPFVKSVILINSLGFGTATANSDIDLMIICKKNRLAITRDLIKFWLIFIKKQKRGKAGKFAFDLWLSEDALNITDFRLPKKDIFFDFWLANFTPIYNFEGTFEKFVKENKTFNKFPNYQVPQKNLFELSQIELKRKKQFENLLETKPFAKILNLSQQKMLARLKKYQRKVQGKGAIVVESDRLRFNIPDKRAEIQKKINILFKNDS